MGRYSSTLVDQYKRPIAGALVYVVDSETNELAVLETDEGDTLDNPFQTPEDGAVLFNAADAFYDLKYWFGGRNYRNDFGVEVGLATLPTAFVADAMGVATNIAPSQRAVTDAFGGLAAPAGSSLIGFLQAGTGATSRTMQSKARDIISVKDFGAVGDGVTDDAAAIQAALDAAGAAGGGVDVFLPGAGNGYRITQGLKLPSYVGLVGNSASRYPFGAGNPGLSKIIADFASANQWVIEPKTEVSGVAVGYNSLIASGDDIDFTYNCSVRDLLITSTGSNMPFGGIRMHGCPGSVINNVAVNAVGCGVLINYSFGGNYSFQCLTPYYGAALLNDCNANSLEVYVAQSDPFPSVVPSGYRLAYMNSLNGSLTTTYGLSTNDHYQRPIGFLAGSNATTSNTSVVDLVVERFTDAIFMLYAFSFNFRKCYLEGSAGQVVTAITLAQSSVTAQEVHAFQSATGSLFDIGKSVTGSFNLSGSISNAAFGTISTDNTTKVVIRSVTFDQVGPATPQYNLLYEMNGAWRPLTLTNGWVGAVGDLTPSYRKEWDRVRFQGTIISGSGTAFTLPAGWRSFATARNESGMISSAGVFTPNGTGTTNLNTLSYEQIA